MKKLPMVLAGLALTALCAATVVGAGTTKPKLSFVKDGGASIGWSNEGGSSPAGGTSNANGVSLRISAPAGGGASAYTYGPDETLVGIRGLRLGQIGHLGFDARGNLGAGAPRISLGTVGDDGPHTYFLSAAHCNDPLSGGWVKADFIHDSTNCEIFRDGTGYIGWAAVAAVADANHETVVESPSDWFLIQDESPALVYVDRLTVGNWCWTGNGTNGTISTNSGDCAS